jgi:muramoyltetrapeptide carboxypeptidase
VSVARKPVARKPGIGFIAPSGQVLDAEALERAIAYFRGRGWRVVAPAALAHAHQRFAGIDARRVHALHAMAARDDVQLVMAVRGGYGLSRLLDRIDYALLAKSGKRYIGHSDFTALLCAGYAHGRLAGLSGPMAGYDFGARSISPYTENHFWNMIDHGQDAVSVTGGSPGAFRAAGPLWGGNLALIAHLAGTPYLPRIRGGLLYVEDINEHPYRIERMILQLQYAGVLARQRALILGDFSEYKLTPGDNGYDFATMVAHLRESLPIPVITGLPFGHVRDKLTLPFGGKAVLEAGRDGWQMEYRARS